MKKNIKIWFNLSLVLSLVLIWFLLPLTTKAGFGISPPWLKNENLVPGSYYEQKIILARDEPTEDWKAEITINVPGAKDWISIDKGTEFILPQGEKQVPIMVKVEVPEEADVGNYQGNLRVKTIPLKPSPKGETAVTILLAAQIDVNLVVKQANPSNLEENQGLNEESDFSLWVGALIFLMILILLIWLERKKRKKMIS